MKRNPNYLRFAAPLLLAALVFGCTKKEEQPASPAPAKQEPATPAATPVQPVQKPLSSAVNPGGELDFRNRTDPFKAPAPAVAAPTGAAAGQPATRRSGDLLPIESFEVGKFKVAGIIAGLQENRALLIDPTGKGYVVQTGMKIGNNDGRITRITSSSVEVVETSRDDSGRVRKRTIVLTLTKKR
jgi:type IV pilus assembly protein PilP